MERGRRGAPAISPILIGIAILTIKFRYLTRAFGRRRPSGSRSIGEMISLSPCDNFASLQITAHLCRSMQVRAAGALDIKVPTDGSQQCRTT